MSKLDENRGYVVLGEDPEGNVVPLKVDPSTGALLISINNVSSTTPVDNSARIDENHTSVAQVVDSSGEIKPLLIDNRNGYLWVALAT